MVETDRHGKDANYLWRLGNPPQRRDKPATDTDSLVQGLSLREKPGTDDINSVPGTPYRGWNRSNPDLENRLPEITNFQLWAVLTGCKSRNPGMMFTIPWVSIVLEFKPIRFCRFPLDVEAFVPRG